MALTDDILYQGQPGATDTDLYVVPSGKKATIVGIWACNTNALSKYFSLHLVQNGGSVNDASALAKKQKLTGTDDPLDGGGVWNLERPFPLNTVGDKISGIQETAGAISLIITGYTEDV